MFWIGLTSLFIMLIDNIASSYFNLNITIILNKIEQTICIILTILVFLGVLSNKPDKIFEEMKEELRSKDNNDKK